MNAPTPAVPPHVVAFIRAHISSLVQLEVLLHVFKASPTALSAARVAKETYLSEPVTSAWLEGFADIGLVERVDGDYRLLEEQGVPELLADVADVFARRRFTVSRLLYGSAPVDAKVSLAEAFRFRRNTRNTRNTRKDC